MENNTRFAAVDGGTGGDGPMKSSRVYENAEAIRLERLVNMVKTQMLLRPIPMTTARELAAWAEERARNIVAALQDQLKEIGQ